MLRGRKTRSQRVAVNGRGVLGLTVSRDERCGRRDYWQREAPVVACTATAEGSRTAEGDLQPANDEVRCLRVPRGDGCVAERRRVDSGIGRPLRNPGRPHRADLVESGGGDSFSGGPGAECHRALLLRDDGWPEEAYVSPSSLCFDDPVLRPHNVEVLWVEDPEVVVPELRAHVCVATEGGTRDSHHAGVNRRARERLVDLPFLVRHGEVALPDTATEAMTVDAGLNPERLRSAVRQSADDLVPDLCTSVRH